MEQDTTGRLEASKAVTRYSGPCNDSAFDQRADAIPDSEVEPDLEFDVSHNNLRWPEPMLIGGCRA